MKLYNGLTVRSLCLRYTAAMLEVYYDAQCKVENLN